MSMTTEPTYVICPKCKDEVRERADGKRLCFQCEEEADMARAKYEDEGE